MLGSLNKKEEPATDFSIAGSELLLVKHGSQSP